MTSAGPALAGLLLLLPLATPALAQRPHRSGFWVEGGGGPTSVRVGCANCSSVVRHPGASSYLRLGLAVSDGVLLGLENLDLIEGNFGFSGHGSATRAELSTLHVVTLWYPWRAGLFIKGGVGISGGAFTFRPDSGQKRTARDTGVGLTFGLGYDLGLTRGLGLTASAAAAISPIGDVELPNGVADDVIATVYYISLGLTVR
jgi:hypothetical protein